jgi:hypothetical protein
MTDTISLLSSLIPADLDWQSFHEALKAIGISITPHGNGLAIKDPHGNHAVKASAVDRALSMKKLESRFGEYRP